MVRSAIGRSRSHTKIFEAVVARTKNLQSMPSFREERSVPDALCRPLARALVLNRMLTREGLDAGRRAEW